MMSTSEEKLYMSEYYEHSSDSTTIASAKNIFFGIIELEDDDNL